MIVLSFDHRSFDQQNMSNQSLPAGGTDPPFSHNGVVSITHDRYIICSKTPICRQLSDHLANEKAGKNTSNDN